MNTWRGENPHSSLPNSHLLQRKISSEIFILSSAAPLMLRRILFFFFFLLPVMNSHSDASLCITMEKREKHMKRGDEREAERIKGLWHRQTASELTFFFFFSLPFCLFYPSPRPPRRFSPRCWSWIMVTLWRLPAPWVYSAQLEWRLVSYTTTHTHPVVPTIQNQCFSPKPSACQLAHWAGGG